MARETGGLTHRRRAGLLLSLFVLPVLSTCVSASLEDAAPVLPPEQDQAVAGDESVKAGSDAETRDMRFVEEGALRNSEFPTFANTPVGATEQLSAADKAQIEAEMEAIRRAYGSGGLSEAAYNARMRELERLARTHASEARQEIEN